MEFLFLTSVDCCGGKLLNRHGRSPVSVSVVDHSRFSRGFRNFVQERKRTPSHFAIAAWSHRYKVEVLAQPAPANGELKHIEWDGWGCDAGWRPDGLCRFQPHRFTFSGGEEPVPRQVQGPPLQR